MTLGGTHQSEILGIAAPLPPGVYVLLIYFALHNVTIKRMDF